MPKARISPTIRAVLRCSGGSFSARMAIKPGYRYPVQFRAQPAWPDPPMQKDQTSIQKSLMLLPKRQYWMDIVRPNGRSCQTR